MTAAYVLGSHVHVGEVQDPVPGKGQALVRTHSCGMCASDAHFLQGGQNVVDLSRQHGLIRNPAYAPLIPPPIA